MHRFGPCLRLAGILGSPGMRSTLPGISGLVMGAALTLFNGEAAESHQPPVDSPTSSIRLLPQLLSKEVFIRPENGRPAASGFVTYIHRTKPILMHCSGRQDYSDGYDDYAV